MMYYVYLLQSLNKEFSYIGSTPDLRKRVKKHNQGKVKSTKPYIPLKLIYYEAYLNEKDAIDREKRLKQRGSSKGHLIKRLKYSFSD
ncbi:MAG: excinuclease abc c subunit domain protein [Candidatus Berkelbacteria bacterium Licking1014_7]|uniref:Excinuclease abc c subunit domain protein n=1 Tax=Candidatus Berkelbacteria bacterium Licking1014_7 TaxID=2017147 RepID=A0A554LJ27_9BACT|nr:MAG: excinuclease abc c subunit domain protein [Candidatus Berkelbacteria bacterium Licking1014_7]